LGVVGYEMLTGRLPFESDVPHEIVAAHLSEVPTPIHTSNPDIPLALSRVVMRCLAKSPGDRWQAARELVDALDCLPLSGTQVASEAPPRSLWARVRAPVFAAIALVAVAATVAIGRGLVLGRDAIRSLAVLPMEIVGDTTTALVFARGFQEELNHELQQIPGLRVALAPPDAMITGVGRRQIGDALGVEHLITSSIRPFGDGYRVEVQLMRVAGEQLRWSERFDVRRMRLDEEQERVARLVSERLLATDTLTGVTPLQRSRIPAAELAYIREIAADAAAELRRKIRTLSGNVQILRFEPRLLVPFVNPVWLQYLSHKIARMLVPYALIATLAANIALAEGHVFYALSLAGQCTFYLLGGYGAWLDHKASRTATITGRHAERQRARSWRSRKDVVNA